VAALVESEGRIFLARRSPKEGHGGLWELPGGKVEAGEKPEGALLRELEEELGIDARLSGRPSRYEARIEGRKYLFLVFSAVFPSDPTKREAHDAFGWFAPEEARALRLAPLDRPALEDWIASLGKERSPWLRGEGAERTTS
jgi:mutator protein MutT